MSLLHLWEKWSLHCRRGSCSQKSSNYSELTEKTLAPSASGCLKEVGVTQGGLTVLLESVYSVLGGQSLMPDTSVVDHILF